MASKHLKQNRQSSRLVVVLVTAFAAVAFVAITAALAAHVTSGSATAARDATSAPSVPQPLSQEGRLIAVSPTSVTAQSADGFSRTYLIDAQTSAITAEGSLIGGAGTTFSVDDEVAIVGVVRDGTAVATAVADRQMTDLDGPPMDAV